MNSEIFFENNCINLSNNNFDLQNLKFKIYVEKLPDNIQFKKYFPFELLNKFLITSNGNTIFQTSGAFIKAKIDAFDPKFKTLKNGYIKSQKDLLKCSSENCEFEIPLFLFENISISSIFQQIKIFVTFNYRITSESEFHPIIKSSIIPIYRNILPTKCEIPITINNFEVYNTNTNQIFSDRINFDGLANYLLFYVKNAQEIDNFELKLLDQSFNYSYDEMNKLIPYYYLGRILPKNYLLINFDGNGQTGLNLSRIDSIKFTIRFKTNVPKKIYLFSESKNIILVENNIMYLIFYYNSLFNTFPIELINKYPKNTDCLICFDDFDKQDIFYECTVCKYSYHSKCLEKWRDQSHVSKCPHCQNNKQMTKFQIKV